MTLTKVLSGFMVASGICPGRFSFVCKSASLVGVRADRIRVKVFYDNPEVLVQTQTPFIVARTQFITRE